MTVKMPRCYLILPYSNSQVANQKRDLLSWYPTISIHWPDMPPYHGHFWSKVVLLNDELKRGFTNKTELRKLNLAVFSGRKKRKTFPPKLNLSVLTNCAMFADEYWDIETEKMQPQLPNFSLILIFENLKNETLNKRVEKKRQKKNLVKVLKSKSTQFALRTLQAWLQQSDK